MCDVCHCCVIVKQYLRYVIVLIIYEQLQRVPSRFLLVVTTILTRLPPQRNTSDLVQGEVSKG